MDDIELVEGIYIKHSKGDFGGGNTYRECVMKSFWFPFKFEDGHVELFPVMDNLKSLMKLKERVPAELFKQEYSVKENSRDIYLELKKFVP